MKRITDLSDNQPSDGVTQTHKYIEFDYDAMEEQAQLVMASSPPGRKEWSDERIAKHTYKPDFGLVKSTYYILDAQGNPISTYFHENKEEGITYQLGEKMIYGSSRLGMKQDALSMLQTTSSPLGSSRKDSALVGLKSYELSNHLGNVLTLFRDVLNGDATNGYWVDVASVSDYSPFGVQLDGRTQGNQGRFGFQGQESDDEIKGNGNSVNYKYRMHDPRVGRFFAVDPLADKYPHYSTYGFSGNHVINSVELEGLEDVRVYDQQNDGTFKYIKTYTNNELQTDVNRYNYKVNNVISDVVFKNEGLRIKYDKVSQIDGKAYAETFNSLIPKPVQETPSPSEGVNYKTQMKNDAWNKGDYSRYFRYLGNQLDQEYEGEKGLVKYSKNINTIGIVLQYTPLAPFGEVLCGGSDLIDTGLDFKNGNPNAWSNTALRLGTTIGGGDKLGAGKYIDKLPVQEFQKQVMKGAVNQGGEVIEDGKTN